jgi:hypothetical protein
MATLEWEVLDTSGVEWEVQDGTVVSWLVQRGPVDVTITNEGGSGLPAGSAGQMFRIGSDGETVEAVSPNAPGSWLRLNENGHVPDTQLAANIVRESEMDTAIATKGRDIYAPVFVMSPATVTAFGGSMVNGVSVTIAALSGVIPSGVDILIWNGTNGAAPNGSYTSNGLGVFTYSARQYLTSASVGDGCVAVQAGDYYTTGAASQQSKWAITTANGTTWGLTAIGGYALTAPITASQEASHSYRAHEGRLGLEQVAEFRKGAGDNQSDGWTSPADAVPTTSYGVVFTGKVDELEGAERFHECMHRGMDAGVGAADSIELAIREWDGATYPADSSVLPDKGELWLYAEGTNQAAGEAWESGDPLPETWQINVDADIKLGCWFTVMLWHNLTTGTVTLYREVDYGGVELVGRKWRQVAQIVEPVDAGSVYLDPAEPWAIGVRFQGPWREAEIYIDGTLAYNPTPDAYAPDSEGNTWTTSTGTVEQSIDTRVGALEAATTTPAPSLLVAGQYSPSSKIAPTNTGLTNNRLYYVPRLIPRDITISRIAVNQAATGSAGVGSVGKFGVYNSVSDLPASSFDLPAGTIDLTTGTGLKYVSGTWVLTAGIWWFAFVAQVTSGSPTFSTAPPDIAVPSNDGTNNGTKFEGGVTGTLPATATPGVANTTGIPIIYLYV